MGKSKKPSKHKNTTVIIVEKDVSVSFEEFEQVMTTIIQAPPVTNKELKKKRD